MASTSALQSVARNASRRPGATFAIALQAIKARDYELAIEALDGILANGQPLPQSACYLHPTGGRTTTRRSLAAGMSGYGTVKIGSAGLLTTGRQI